MSASGNAEQVNARSLARLPIGRFIFLCIGLSAGGIFLFAIGDAGSGWDFLLYALVPPLALIVIRKSFQRRDRTASGDHAIVRPVRPATAPISQTNQRPYVGEFWQTARPGLRSLKQLLIIASIIVAAILVVGIILSNGGPKLKVQTQAGLLSIQNIGGEPITIRHLSVNDRPDCRMQRAPIDLLFAQVAPPGEAPTLKVGDVADWTVYCPIVRLTVETDRGTATYTFD
jgi:hypothetical protein